jgi:8-oxo-dGTP pyrophosphatase MutT (NUDIX family)
MHTLTRLAYRIYRRCKSVVQPLTLGVRALLVEQSQITLVQHRYLDGWYLPGGGVKPHETPEQAIRREVHEEIGTALGSLDLFGVYTNFEGRSDHIVVFRCGDMMRAERHSWEVTRVAAFALDQLPETTSPGTRRRIAELCAHAPTRYGAW